MPIKVINNKIKLYYKNKTLVKLFRKQLIVKTYKNEQYFNSLINIIFNGLIYTLAIRLQFILKHYFFLFDTLKIYMF